MNRLSRRLRLAPFVWETAENRVRCTELVMVRAVTAGMSLHRYGVWNDMRDASWIGDIDMLSVKARIGKRRP